jgi:uncharacterized protein YcbX
MTSTVRIHSLHFYPLKSTRAIDCPQLEIDADGARHDRQWMLIDEHGRFVTQRSHPRLALISARPDAAGNLLLRAPDGSELWVSTPDVLPVSLEEQLAVKVWGRELSARDAGPAGAAFLSRALGTRVRLVYAEKARFVDGYPLLVCSLASLAALNERLPQPIPMNRFRPNIVLEGDVPWAEDRYRTLRIGALTLKLVKACTRCTITGVDQADASAHSSPLAALKEFRYDPALRGVTFGQNARVSGGAGALLRIGDAVEGDEIRPL